MVEHGVSTVMDTVPGLPGPTHATRPADTADPRLPQDGVHGPLLNPTRLAGDTVQASLAESEGRGLL